MSFYGIAPIRFGSLSMVTATLGPKDPEVGARCVDAGLEYAFVYNDADTQGIPGQGFVTNAGTTTGYSCTISATTSADIVIGVVKHATITTNTYGWVVVKGVTSVKMGATSGTVATGGLIEVAANGLFVPVSNTTGNKSPCVGKALNTIASSALGDAFISCYG